jgi:alginate O-acetyltransferase complex protein AlgI
MRFNSYLFLIALAIFVALLWAMPVRFRRAWLLAGSYAFYASWSIWFLVVLMGVGILNYYGARWVASAPERTERVASVIAANVTVLVLFKYFDWMCESVGALTHLFGMHLAIEPPHWALPLGISFYVFESISYVVDVARRRQAPRGFVDMQLFVAFFPKLIAGPILRGREFFPQLEFARVLDAASIRYALRQIVIGLFLKTVLVDRAFFGLADNVDEAFARPYQSATSLDAWIMSLGFCLQLYFDYSAYTRIALGAGKLCGITLVENFNHPFMSASPAEFWQRWNISLSRWIRDYLFVPLQGGQVGRLRAAWAASVSMIVFGVWHGAGWNFVAWGAFHGLILTGYYWFGNTGASMVQHDGPVIRRAVAGWAFTIGMFCLSMLLWRCRDATAALNLVWRAVNPWSYPGVSLSRMCVAITLQLAVSVLVAGITSRFWRDYQRGERSLLRYAFAMAEGSALAMLFAVCVIHLQNRRTFVYFEF